MYREGHFRAPTLQGKAFLLTARKPCLCPQALITLDSEINDYKSAQSIGILKVEPRKLWRSTQQDENEWHRINGQLCFRSIESYVILSL